MLKWKNKKWQTSNRNRSLKYHCKKPWILNAMNHYFEILLFLKYFYNYSFKLSILLNSILLFKVLFLFIFILWNSQFIINLICGDFISETVNFESVIHHSRLEKKLLPFWERYKASYSLFSGSLCPPLFLAFADGIKLATYFHI